MQKLDLDIVRYYNGKIYIFGAGRVSESLVVALKSCNINVSGIVVTNLNNNFKYIEGIPVISLQDYSGRCMDTMLIIAVREKYIDEVINEVTSLKIDQIVKIDIKKCISILEGVFHSQIKNEKRMITINNYRKNLSDEEYMFFLEKQIRNGNLTIEVNVVDHCNLNCQSCNHFSPLSEKKYLNIDLYKDDLFRLKEVCKSKIGKFMLLGGEPLLHKKINEILIITRRILGSDVSIKIITNGLCISEMPESFWKICKQNDIALEYTEYPVKLNYESLKKKIKDKYGVIICNESAERVKTTYKLPLVDSKLDPYLNYMKCNLANQCIVLKEGRLYPCPIAANIDIFNKYYNKTYPTKENGIDIYLNEYDDIADFLANPVSMCQYCDICNYQYNIPWATSKKKIGEWM